MRTDIFADNYISLDSNKYDSMEEFFEDISTLMRILTKNEYQCAFKYDDAGIYILEFDNDNPTYGSPNIYWLDEEQLDCLYSSKYIESEEES